MAKLEVLTFKQPSPDDFKGLDKAFDEITNAHIGILKNLRKVAHESLREKLNDQNSGAPYNT